MKKILLIISIVLLTHISQAAENHHHKHKHSMIEASSPFPTLSIKIEKDAMSGYNLTLLTTNFEFAPENVNKKNNGNEGHAHIYINGQKYRQYSPYFHIPAQFLKKEITKLK